MAKGPAPGEGQPRPKGHGSRSSPTKRTRRPWGTLSRSQVVDAALAIVESGGYDEMTIRSLATELGVAPMSLYRHVRDKDDLLDEVVDRLLEASWRPEASATSWRAWLEEAAERLRALLVDHPAALRVFLRHPVVSPAAIARMERVLEVLRSAGLDDAEAWRAYATIHTYTVGFAALQASRAGWAPEGGSSGLAGRLAGLATARQFADGLAWFLDAVERGVDAGTGVPERGATSAAPDGDEGPEVVEEAAAHRFVVAGADPPAELVYHEEPGRLVLLHTGVPPERRGRGEAARLVAAALARARRDDLAIVPACSYVRRYLAANPDEAASVAVDWPEDV